MTIECTCKEGEPTRLVAEWLHRDDTARRRLTAFARRIQCDESAKTAGTNARETGDEAARYELGRLIHTELWTNEVMALDGWQGDLLRLTLANVNCFAIAQEYLTDNQRKSRPRKDT